MEGVTDEGEFHMRALFHYLPSSMTRAEWNELTDVWGDNMDFLHRVTLHGGRTEYEPQGMVSAPVLLLRAGDSPEFASCIEVNRKYCKNMEVVILGGRHYTVMRDPHALPTATAIQ